MLYPSDLDNLGRFAEFPKEREAIEAVRTYGNPRKAETALGLGNDTIGKPLRRVRARAAEAALKGDAPHAHLSDPIPDPFLLKRISLNLGPDGELRQKWLIAEPDREKAAEALREFVAELCEGARGLSPLGPRPALLNSSILTVYKFGDPHFGMEASPEAGGDAFDLDEADRLTRAGIDRLVLVAPPSETCIIEVIGDTLHANDSSALTPASRHPLDVDRRGFSYALLRAGRAWRYVIDRALEKHETVIVWILEGNHDPDAAAALALALAFYYENNPRVQIDVSRAVFRYYRFGKVLLGAHHGDKVKMADLPLLMAVDRAEDWGETLFRYIDTGHIHHDVVKEVQGVRVESLRTLAAKDPFHASKGYRSLRDTRAVVYHAEGGECERYTVSAVMLDALAA